MLREAADFQHAADPLAQWLAQETVSTPDATTPQDRLHAAYAEACASLDRPMMTKQMFGRRLRTLRPEVQEGQRTIEGERRWVYLGIALAPERRSGCDPDGMKGGGWEADG